VEIPRHKSSLLNQIIFAFLILINIFLLIKLNFYLPQLTGSVVLFDFDTYFNLLNDIKKNINPYTVDYMQTLGPPLVFSFFLPFSYLNLVDARSLISFLSIVLGILSCALLAKKFNNRNKKSHFLLYTFILFSSFPARFAIENGQPILVLVFLITVILTVDTSWKKSLSLALLITIKTFFIVVFLAFIKKKEIVFNSIVFLGAVFILSSTLVKPQLYPFYIREKLPALISTDSIEKSTNYYNQSLRSTMHRLNAESIYQFTFYIVLLFLIFYIIKSENFEASVVSAILLSPFSWQHYYAALFPVFVSAYLLSANRPVLRFFLFVSVLAWWIEFPQLHEVKLVFSSGLLASHYFFSGLLLMLVLIKLPNKKSA